MPVPLSQARHICEYFCFSGGSHTSAPRACYQPAPTGIFRGRLVVRERALLAAGEVDLAMAGIRAAQSGCHRLIAASTA